MNKYNRLTERKEDREYLQEEFWYSANEPSVEEIDEIYKRLAELEDKIENGTLIELPCKVGDAVYTIEGGIIEEHEVMGILIQFNELFFKILRKRDLVCKFWGSLSVFLTKAEAEAKLNELQGE